MGNQFPRKEIVERIRAEFPKGTRVVLDYMNDPYRDMPSGMEGIVRGVDDTGTIFVNWSNGSGLGVVYGEDQCHKVGKTAEEKKVCLDEEVEQHND